MIPASVIKKLYALKLDDEQMDAVVGLLEEVSGVASAEAGAALEARRAADRQRKQKSRGTMSQDVTGRPVTAVTSRDNPPSPQAKEPPTPQENSTPLTPATLTAPERKKPARGTRLVEAWRPSEDDLAALDRQGVSRDMARRSFVMFQNHFLAKSGPEALKVEWGRTFRNWCLSDLNGSKRNGAPHARAGPANDEIRDPIIAAIQRRFAQ